MATVITMQLNKEEVCVDRAEGLRYIGYRPDTPSDILEKRADSVLKRIREILLPKACYLKVPVSIEETTDEIDFSCMKIRSKSLAYTLKGCKEAYLFAATTGSMLDREIARSTRKSAVDGLLTDAMGSAGIEGICDLVCERLEEIEKKPLTIRFSPGYGDLNIEIQKEFLQVLDCNRKIGLTLTGEMMMTPMKSVTAIVGIDGDRTRHHKTGGCANCSETSCEFRKE